MQGFDDRCISSCFYSPWHDLVCCFRHLDTAVRATLEKKWWQDAEKLPVILLKLSTQIVLSAEWKHGKLQCKSIVWKRDETRVGCLGFFFFTSIGWIPKGKKVKNLEWDRKVPNKFPWTASKKQTLSWWSETWIWPRECKLDHFGTSLNVLGGLPAAVPLKPRNLWKKGKELTDVLKEDAFFFYCFAILGTDWLGLSAATLNAPTTQRFAEATSAENRKDQSL